MFNLQGSELVIILLLALVVLGPEKLPDAMRKMGRFYGDLKKMSTSFQEEFRSAVDEPMRELRQTADTVRDSVDFGRLRDGERGEKPKSAEMAAASPSPESAPGVGVPGGPTDDVPFASSPAAAAPIESPPLEAVIDESGLREARPTAAGEAGAS